MRCIIIEDQPPAQRILQRYIEGVACLRLNATFPDAIQAMKYLETVSVDLIFLDIHLPKISGIDLLKKTPHLPPVILTTAFPDYALESYEFDVVDYLLKPFSFQRFVKAVAKITDKQEAKTLKKTERSEAARDEIYIKSGYERIRILVGDIIYIKSDADYTEIVMLERKYVSAKPLRYWVEKLDDQQFTRIHKSYMINTTRIEKISTNQVHLATGSVVPIGRAYKTSFIQRFVK